MKHSIIFAFIIFSIFKIDNCFGQKIKGSYLDTIYLNIENDVEVIIATKDYNEVKDSIISDLKNLKQLLIQEKEPLKNEGTYKIIYRPDQNLIISPFTPIQKIVLHKGIRTKFIINGQCTIIGDKYTLQILMNNPEDIFNDKISDEIKRVFSDLPDKCRIALTYDYSVKNGALVHNEYDIHNGKMDYLEIDFGTGANLIKNQPVMDIFVRTGMVFNKKGILKHHFYSSANFMFLFDENDDVINNTFLNLGYERNLSDNLLENKWLGAEIGYLVNRNGDFFGDNVFRIGINMKVIKAVSLSSYLYLEDGKKFYPGLRVGFEF